MKKLLLLLIIPLLSFGQTINDLYSLINTHDIIGGVYIPNDGQADPIGVTNVLAKAARQNGAKIIEHCSVKKY